MRPGDVVADRFEIDRRAGSGGMGEVWRARGIVHRDLKPSNLFLVDGALDRVKVIDFGVARRALTMRALTQSGSLVGTPSYMAPEQARSERVMDARVDVFALGCVLFECVT